MEKGYGRVPKDNILKGMSIEAQIAYANRYMEEYDCWEVFACHNCYTIPYLQDMVEYITIVHGDDPRAWLLAMDCIYQPMKHKLVAVSMMLNELISAYKTEQPYETIEQLFDEYQSASANLTHNKKDIIGQMKEYMDWAVKRGLASEKAMLADAKIQETEHLLKQIEPVSKLDDIRPIRDYDLVQKKKLMTKYLDEGLDPELYYSNALTFMKQMNYVDAIKTLMKIPKYRNVKQLLHSINSAYRFGQMYQTNGVYYYLTETKNRPRGRNRIPGYYMYATLDGDITQPIIDDVKFIITAYANKFYYVASDDSIHMYHIQEKRNRVLMSGLSFTEENYILSEDHSLAYVLSCFNPNEDNIRNRTYNVLQINLNDEMIEVVAEKIISLFAVVKGILIASEYTGVNTENGRYRTAINNFALNLKTKTKQLICYGTIKMCAVTDEYFIYTKDAPDENNRDLCIVFRKAKLKEQILERNIYGFLYNESNKIYYVVGSKRDNSLYSIEVNGMNRKQLRVQNVLELVHENDRYIYVAAVSVTSVSAAEAESDLESDSAAAELAVTRASAITAAALAERSTEAEPIPMASELSPGRLQETGELSDGDFSVYGYLSQRVLIQLDKTTGQSTKLGTRFSRMVGVHYGYGFYLDNHDSLYRASLDGLDVKLLCHNVKQVILIRRGRIYYLKQEGQHNSLYCIQAAAEKTYGCKGQQDQLLLMPQKLVYDVIQARVADSREYIDYQKKIPSGIQYQRMDVGTYKSLLCLTTR